MWARIESGTVAETTQIDPKGLFHSSLKWVSCNENVTPGDRYDGEKFFSPQSPKPNERRAEARRSIDLSAGRARSRFISAGDLVETEYLQAETAAREYVDGNYPEKVPASIESWAAATGLSAEEAANNILATASQWRQVLDQIRAIRLTGKAAVDAAEDDDIDATAANYIGQLNGVAPS